MEKKITVRNKQSLLDIALQSCGSFEAVFEIAYANDVSITDDLEPGSELFIPDCIVDRDILNYYTINNVIPTTAQ